MGSVDWIPVYTWKSGKLAGAKLEAARSDILAQTTVRRLPRLKREL